jgi:hypothetical protein
MDFRLVQVAIPARDDNSKTRKAESSPALGKSCETLDPSGTTLEGAGQSLDCRASIFSVVAEGSLDSSLLQLMQESHDIVCA